MFNRLPQLISSKASRMILFCYLLCVLGSWATFVMLEDWLLPCHVLDLDSMFFVAVLFLNSVTNFSPLFNFCSRDLISWPWTWLRQHNLRIVMLKTLDQSIWWAALKKWRPLSITKSIRYLKFISLFRILLWIAGYASYVQGSVGFFFLQF